MCSIGARIPRPEKRALWGTYIHTYLGSAGVISASNTETDRLTDHGTAVIRYDTIRYVTRCRFNVRSKADISQLNLPHGTNNLKVEREKNYEAKTDKRRSIGDNRPHSDTV